MRDTTHLAWRAALAVFLMGAFYVLALAMVAVLIAIPLGLLRLHASGLVVKVGFFCVIGVYVILKSIVPRPDRFEPPGPRLAPEEQPRLFARIRSVALAVRQDQPAEVYLVPDVNAWVRHRGGTMGIGSRRVMGLGLPLLQILTVPELSAVLAHEFGHFHGGDVAIGPWIYRTRDMLVRTVVELSSHSKALSAPFVWYGNQFFRITHAVSRHQEVLADRLAAEAVGAEPLASGLRAVHGGGVAFVPYWKGAVEPVLAAGFVPPLAAGFETFLKTPWVAQKVSELLKEEAGSKPDPLDTHPPLSERLKALRVDPARTPARTGATALSLLDRVPALEAELASFVRRGSDTSSDETLSLNLGVDPRTLSPVAWDEVGARVWLPYWKRTAPKFTKPLAGITPASLPELDWTAFGRKIVAGQSGMPPLEAADFVVGVGLALAFSGAGFTVDIPPGSEPLFVGLGERVRAFNIREELAKGSEAAEAWRGLCTQAGIADADLGAACAQSNPSRERGRP